jgi:hypothetical protein
MRTFVRKALVTVDLHCGQMSLLSTAVGTLRVYRNRRNETKQPMIHMAMNTNYRRIIFRSGIFYTFRLLNTSVPH